jgi:ribosomal protein L7/L12
VNDVLLVLLIGLVIVGVMLVRRTRLLERPDVPGVSEPSRATRQDLLAQPVDPMVVAAVMSLLGRNKKIQAVKEIMNATGLRLPDAKALVEAMQRGHRPPAVVIRGDAVDITPAPRQRPADLADRVRALRDQGREIEAIKLVRAETGMGLAEAETFVRTLT